MDELVINNKYRILRLLGEGGMGAVYEAVHVDLGTRLALKQLKEKFAGSKDIMKRFKREGRDMFRLMHPHIVRVFDYGLETGFGAYLVMDLVDGPNLDEMIKERGPLGIDEVIRIGSEVASALNYAHTQIGLVHRDIKSKNILVERTTGRAVVTDFGIAKHTQQKDEETTTSDIFTDIGVFVGTKRYSSPEQLRAEELDQRSDIYSLGAVLYEMCSGRIYLEGMQENIITIRIGGFADWKPELPYPAPVPQALVDLIDACIERDRDKRIASALEVTERLQRCRDHAVPLQPRPVAPVPKPAPVESTEEHTIETEVDRFDEMRGRLRREAETVVDRLAGLDQIALAVGMQDIGVEPVTEIRARLDNVAEIEAGGNFALAVQDLKDVADLADARKRDVDQLLRERIEEVRGALADGWQDFAGRANGFLSETQISHFQQTLAFVLERAKDDDWELASKALAEARQAQAEAEANAQQLAEREARAAVESIRSATEALEGFDALPAGFNRAVVEAEIEGALAEGHYAKARATAKNAVEVLQTAHADRVRRETERAKSAREDLAAFLHEVNFDNVPQPVAEILERAREQNRNADAALQQDDYTAAADGYDRALQEYRRADERARVDAFTAQLRAQQDILARLERLGASARAAGLEHAEAELAPANRALKQLEDGRDSLDADAAAAQLSAATALVGKARDEEEKEIRLALANAIESVAETWAAFTDNADQFASAEQRDSMRRSLEAAYLQLDGQALEACLRMPAELRERVAQAEREATNAAQTQVELLLRRAEEQYAAIDALDPAAVPADVDLEQLRRDVEQQLADGHLAALDELASSALNRLTDALAELRRVDREKAEAARADWQAVEVGIDPGAAARVAREQFDAGVVAGERAEAAFAHGDHRAATAAYGVAQLAYAAVAQRLEAARNAALEQLEAAIGRARDQPDELVGAARRRGEPMLAGAASLDGLEQAAAEIEAALSEVDAYGAAAEAKQRCSSAEGELLKRSPRALARRPIRRRTKAAKTLRAKADTALEQRSWTPAAQAFIAAASAWSELQAEVDRYEKQPPSSYRLWAIGGSGAAAVAAGIILWIIVPVPEVAPPDAPIEQPVPQPPAQAPFTFMRSQPDATKLTLREGTAQDFSVAVDGGAPGAIPDLRWSLDGRALGVKGKEWSYTPDFKAGRAQPYAVRVQIGEGGDVKQWDVRVDDVNRAPVVTKATDPDKAAKDETVTLQADAKDADEDPLQYAWMVDGKPAGSNEPKLDLKVTADHKVALAVSDGKVSEPVSVGWDVAMVALPPLVIQADPATVGSLQFGKSQRFKLSPPASAKGLKYDWRLNGAKVVGNTSYEFANDDPALVGKSAKLVVSVVDEGNRPFTKPWTFKVVPPPAPRIESPEPVSPVEVKAGSAVDLSVTPSRLVRGQTATYVFSVDGSERKSTEPTLRFTPTNDEHTVMALAVDNFDQSSDRVTWSIRRASIAPPTLGSFPDGAQLVRTWLENYRDAFVRKDVAALQAMMKLSSDKAETLRKQLALQNDLEVAFSNVAVESLGDGRYSATYTRRDSFTNAQTGRPTSPGAVSIRQEFRSVGGRVQLEK